MNAKPRNIFDHIRGLVESGETDSIVPDIQRLLKVEIDDGYNLVARLNEGGLSDRIVLGVIAAEVIVDTSGPRAFDTMGTPVFRGNLVAEAEAQSDGEAFVNVFFVSEITPGSSIVTVEYEMEVGGFHGARDGHRIDICDTVKASII